MIVLMHATMRERPPERCRSLSAAHQYDQGKHGLVYGFLHGEEQPAMAWVRIQSLSFRGCRDDIDQFGWQRISRLNIDAEPGEVVL